MNKPNRKELYRKVIEFQQQGLSLGETEIQIGIIYNCSPRTIRRWLHDLRISWEIPVSTRPKWVDVVELTGDGIALYADLHCDFHDAAFIKKAMEFQVDHGVLQAAIVGDGADMQLFSPFIPEPDSGFAQEAEALRVIINNINSISPNGLVYIEGNHEARIFKALKRAVGMREFLDMIGVDDDVVASDYRYFNWNNWRISHPNEYSRVKGSKTKMLVAKHHCHIAVAHLHRYSLATGTGGKYIALELGMMADPERLPYYQKAETTGPTFEQSFTIIKRGENGKYKIHTIWGENTPTIS